MSKIKILEMLHYLLGAGYNGTIDEVIEKLEFDYENVIDALDDAGNPADPTEIMKVLSDVFIVK